MKPITLHPSSLLVGAAFTLLAVVAMGQKTVPTSTSTNQLPPAGEYRERLERQPKFAVHPRDWVQIVEGNGYTVPPGKILAITALGGSDSNVNNPGQLLVDGATALEGYTNLGVAPGTSVKPVPRGLSIPAGGLVEVQGGSVLLDDARAWGYLVDA